MKQYKLTGQVLGKLWGGGEGYYPSREIKGNNRTDVIREAEEALEDGSLDSGMGFERLVGAFLILEIKTIKTVDGVEYYREDYEDINIGGISPKVREELRSKYGFYNI